MVFVDTSAFFALLDENDRYHGRAAAWLAGPGRDPGLTLATHNYVVVESSALVHRRLGIEAVRVLLETYIPTVNVVYVGESLHRVATSAYLAALRRGTSFVDRVSVELMRGHGIRRAFAFDEDFTDEGFELVA
jgi:predicted nucleic acid-binding protein